MATPIPAYAARPDPRIAAAKARRHRIALVTASVAVLISLCAGPAVYLWKDGRAEVATDRTDDVAAIAAAKLAVPAALPQVQSVTYGKIFVH